MDQPVHKQRVKISLHNLDSRSDNSYTVLYIVNIFIGTLIQIKLKLTDVVFNLNYI